MFRAFGASEASTRSSTRMRTGVRIDDVEDACACALTHGRGRWYETFSAGDRTRLVDDWFAARGLGASDGGAVKRLVTSGRSTATARGGGGGGLVSAEETVVVESAVRITSSSRGAVRSGRWCVSRSAPRDDAGGETAEMTLSAFDGLVDGLRYRITKRLMRTTPGGPTGDRCGGDAPRSAARTASRACRRAAPRRSLEDAARARRACGRWT